MNTDNLSDLTVKIEHLKAIIEDLQSDIRLIKRGHLIALNAHNEMCNDACQDLRTMNECVPFGQCDTCPKLYRF